MGDTLRASHDPATGRTVLTWSSILAGQYNTYRGSIPRRGMGTRGSPYNQECFESDDAFGDGALRSTDDVTPTVDTTLYYIVDGESG